MNQILLVQEEKLEFTFNNSDKNSEYKFNTTDRFFLNQKC